MLACNLQISFSFDKVTSAIICSYLFFRLYHIYLALLVAHNLIDRILILDY